MSASVSGQYSITVLHNNDGESQLIDAGAGSSDFGGVARFKTLVDQTRSFYEGQGHGVLTISSGDNFLAGPEFEASRAAGTYYDALAISAINYDAVIIGNHEFDFGPNVLADFIGDAQASNATKFLSANLDFSGEAALQSQVTAGNIAASTIVNVPTSAGTKSVGIIGATTENLGFISSPGNVGINGVAAAVNAEIAALSGSVDHIVLASHLQGIEEDQTLVPLLNPGVDLIIAGGGDDRLANPGAASPASVYAGAPGSIVDTGFVPGDSAAGDYPTPSMGMDLGGNSIPIVSTDANYKYLGRFTMNFDAAGNLTGADVTSNPQRVASSVVDPTHGVPSDAALQASVVDPVNNFVSSLASTIIGTTSQDIIGGASSDIIRSNERNGGNLVADAYFAKATELAAANPNVDAPTVAIVNGGGIRADISVGDISVLDTFNISPFGNGVSLIEDVTAADLKQLLENAYSRTVDGPEPGIDPVRQGDGTGRFAHLSGMSVTYDILAQPLVLDSDGNILTEGTRILDVVLDDGTVIVEDGVVVYGGTIDIATASFLATGGDQYFDEDYLSQAYSFVNLGATDQQAVNDYISSFMGSDLSLDPRYDLIADGRIVTVPEPGTFGMSIVLVALMFVIRRNH